MEQGAQRRQRLGDDLSLLLDALDKPLTTPYVLLDFGKEDWTAYLKKSLLDLKVPEEMRMAYFLKHGREPNQWNEFIFQAYHHHQSDAIFLTGLPDVSGSLPHGPRD